MKTYVALLRAVNVGGKNKVPMKELKEAFEKFGYINVKTYINSGNVIFSSDEKDIESIKRASEEIIKKEFNLDITVLIIEIDNLIDVIDNIPLELQEIDKDYYDTIIFVIPPTSTEEIFEALKSKVTEHESMYVYKNVFYWRAKLSAFQKTVLSKFASSKVNNLVTIRTINTAKKILEVHKK
ncbi:DUF1697 domain-containing protein [Haploplasma axanthum]|uniref:Uncharacterized protein conserved in bacteria n=1 Tax=Haploplasma axanthum TaxID=29552 RepID=A0A449BFM0_HAPAX|nr:DUF1697 domain-containing protein [Haploplasma axanthum]VEU81257.1 Uncharacterized protein conserved in bacteria [Haploplasma axanthum]